MRRATAGGVAGIGGGILALGLAGAFLLTGAGDDPALLQMHRAVYDLSVDSVKTGSEVVSLEGRMVVEWRGGPGCEGYVSDQRVVNRILDGAGVETVSDVRLSTFESLDGAEFRFDRLEYLDGELAAHESGHAYRKADSIFLDEPDKARRRLPASVLFPTAFNVELIEAARAGMAVYGGSLFDGTQPSLTHVTAFIGKPAAAPPDARGLPAANGTGTLGDARAWPVQMSYFDEGEGAHDGTPSLELGFAMFPNGVTSALKLGYDEVVLRGDLTEIEYFKPGRC